jgi:hypothetical protein
MKLVAQTWLWVMVVAIVSAIGIIETLIDRTSAHKDQIDIPVYTGSFDIGKQIEIEFKQHDPYIIYIDTNIQPAPEGEQWKVVKDGEFNIYPLPDKEHEYWVEEAPADKFVLFPAKDGTQIEVIIRKKVVEKP